MPPNLAGSSHVMPAGQHPHGLPIHIYQLSYCIVSLRRWPQMSRGSVDMNFLFALGELQRLVRAYADKQAARYGITRAQWAVLAKVERAEGLKQTELAEQMEMQPITLTRLIDRLCDNGWI